MAYVDKMIIIAHGDYDILQFSPSNGQIYLSDISDYITPACEIKLLDIQACYCGDMRFDSEMNRETCIAYEFASKAQINKVYAWTGKAVYYGGVNSSINGIYVLYYQDDGVVDYKKVGIISKCFAPLEY